MELEKPATPFFREAGTGPSVVCVHSNASSSSQWRALMEALSPRYHVLAPDSYGSGKSPVWPAGAAGTLDEEVALLEPVFARARAPFVLVGHSYGGAIALIAALRKPERVRALVLYEPTLFSLIEAESPPPNDADGIRDASAAATLRLEAGDPRGAAECFIDFWMGAGGWASMPPERQVSIAKMIVCIPLWGHALMKDPTPLSAFRALERPVLLLSGKASPLSALGVARRLGPVLPQVETLELDGLGHMAPVTDPERVNPPILRFLERL